MIMQSLWTASAVAALALLGPAARADEKANLKVLYAGNVNSPRAKDFTSFLEKHFVKVTPVDLGKLHDADAQGHDVVLVDWTSIYPRDKDGKITRDDQSPGISMPPAVQLSRDFDRPTVLIGAAGGKCSQGRDLKINWL
jgi:hypothetical protein